MHSWHVCATHTHISFSLQDNKSPLQPLSSVVPDRDRRGHSEDGEDEVAGDDPAGRVG